MDKLLTKVGVSFALFLMVCELSYVNAKSLLYIVAEFGFVDKLFAVVGAMAFSMVTVLVMRKGTRPWMKLVFPIFDTLLVFGGFNLKFADNMLGNPVAFGLTIFMALFTGFITYSLGQINYTDHAVDSEATKVETKRIVADLESKQFESNRMVEVLRRELNDSRGNEEQLEVIITNLHRINNELTERVADSSRNVDELNLSLTNTLASLDESKRISAELEASLKEVRTAATTFLQSHILYENWIGKKKSAGNRNGKEALLGKMAEEIKAGKVIPVQVFLEKVSA
ncbi:hypothetical protein [Williamwhitmania taraxaci]|uniref:Uncharacterized protein n=1 Tax=Williamwhitmania taraxaci TaxID=1640674 RepID=A0A1G6MDD4_9BACT|nr:hypothetical protein [Williamwhitmania taraxaci]SDC53274.1 hypothetical protein SAMN05216323_103539 [Williamwhitmania taraxaci]